MDGLKSRQKMITFIETDDGLNRFSVAGSTAGRNRLAWKNEDLPGPDSGC